MTTDTAVHYRFKFSKAMGYPRGGTVFFADYSDSQARSNVREWLSMHNGTMPHGPEWIVAPELFRSDGETYEPIPLTDGTDSPIPSDVEVREY